MRNELTVLIPTHAVKVEQIGPYKNHRQQNRTAPYTDLIEKVIKNIQESLTLFDLQFVIGLDHKEDDDLSCEYLENLKKLGHTVITTDSKLEDKPLTTVTATRNFLNLIDHSPTEWFMLWEHDWVFSDSDFIREKQESILASTLWHTPLGRDVMLRFNQRENKTYEGHEFVWVEYESPETKGQVLRTSLYSNNPFITSKTYWKKFFEPYAREIPDWWGEHGAFIEGPINRNLKEKHNVEDYTINLFGNMGMKASVHHLNGQVWDNRND